MDYYGFGIYAKILSGNIMKMLKPLTKARDAAEAINMAAKSLTKEAQAWFNNSSWYGF